MLLNFSFSPFLSFSLWEELEESEEDVDLDDEEDDGANDGADDDEEDENASSFFMMLRALLRLPKSSSHLFFRLPSLAFALWDDFVVGLDCSSPFELEEEDEEEDDDESVSSVVVFFEYFLFCFEFFLTFATPLSVSGFSSLLRFFLIDVFFSLPLRFLLEDDLLELDGIDNEEDFEEEEEEEDADDEEEWEEDDDDEASIVSSRFLLLLPF